MKGRRSRDRETDLLLERKDVELELRLDLGVLLLDALEALDAFSDRRRKRVEEGRRAAGAGGRLEAVLLLQGGEEVGVLKMHRVGRVEAWGVRDVSWARKRGRVGAKKGRRARDGSEGTGRSVEIEQETR